MTTTESTVLCFSQRVGIFKDFYYLKGIGSCQFVLASSIQHVRAEGWVCSHELNEIATGWHLSRLQSFLDFP